MRTEILKNSLNGELFALRQTELDALTAFINSATEAKVGYEGAQPDTVNYEVIDRAAIISIDGAMAKKGYTGLCMSVFGYNQIVGMIDKAEADPSVDKIIFIVDSPGGAVLGINELSERVRWASKPTVTFYDNIGASAAIWAFLGADKVYASPITLLGSIGVMAVVTEVDKSGKTILTSRGAGNKVCGSKEECLQQLQARLDKYESYFYQAVSAARPGFDAERIRETFNDGGVIFADEAEWNGFIDGIMSMKQLFDKEI
jgi:protease-4